MAHGDDKGLVIPPKIAENKVVVVPILFEDSKEKVLKKSKEITKNLNKFNAFLDERDYISPGWKFSEWELKGIPVRIEIGPKDLINKKITIVRRDTLEKESVSEKDLGKRVSEILDEIQKNLFNKSKKFLDGRIDEAKDMQELKRKIKEGKIVKIYMKNDLKVEERLKEQIEGAGSRIVEIVKKEGVCVISGEKTNNVAYISKAY